MEKRLGVEALATVIIKFESDGIAEYGSLVVALERNEYRSKPKKFELDMKHHKSPHRKPSIQEAPKLKLNVLPPHMRYVFFGKDDTLLVVIVEDLNEQQTGCYWRF